jgi:hypothetical protein
LTTAITAASVDLRATQRSPIVRSFASRKKAREDGRLKKPAPVRAKGAAHAARALNVEDVVEADEGQVVDDLDENDDYAENSVDEDDFAEDDEDVISRKKVVAATSTNVTQQSSSSSSASASVSMRAI